MPRSRRSQGRAWNRPVHRHGQPPLRRLGAWLAWDSQQRLTQVSVPELTATYQYDLLGRRVQRQITKPGFPPETTHYVYDGLQAVGEIRPQQSSTSLMTGLNLDEMLARVTTLNATNTTQARTYLTDALGSVMAQTQDNQSTLAGYSYSPYGQTQSTGNPEGDSVQYTGRENDNNGLYYYRARYYDPVLKRFLSEDPIGLAGGSLSFYAYVEGNPVSYTDPEGKQLTIGGGIAIGLGAYGGYSLFKKYQRERQCAQECKLQCENNVACDDPDRSKLYEANAPRCIAGCIPLCVGEFMGGPKKGPTGPQPPSQKPDYIKYRHYPK